MLDIHQNDIYEMKNLSDYWQAFIDYIQDQELEWINIEEVRKTCRKIEINHKGRNRYVWWEYVEHLYEAARNYIDLWWKISQEGIIACLHHDDIEDIRWKTFETFKDIYDIKVAFIIHILSRKIDKNWNPTESKKEYLDRFLSIPGLISFMKQEALTLCIELPDSDEKLSILANEIATIKLCDRINNLSTEHKVGENDEKRLIRAERKLKETEEIFIPLVQSMNNPILFDRLRTEIIFLTRRIIKLKAKIRTATES